MKRKRIDAPQVEWMGSLPKEQKQAQLANEEQEMAYEMQELMLGAESDEETEDTDAALTVQQYDSDEARDDDDMSDEEEQK